MLHSRGELLLMLDADGATKVNDLEKLENEVCIIPHVYWYFHITFLVVKILVQCGDVNKATANYLLLCLPDSCFCQKRVSFWGFSSQ